MKQTKVRIIKPDADGGPEIVEVGGSVRVKVYTIERKGKPAYWQIADYTTGERKFRTFADHGKALGEAERIGIALANGEGLAARASATDLASYGRSVELLKPTGDSLELAASIFAEAAQILGTSKLILEACRDFKARRLAVRENRTLQEVVDELLEVKSRQGGSPRYLEDLRSRLNRFALAFQMPIAQVITTDVQQWLDRLDVSQQTRRNFRTVLGTLFNFAQSRGFIAKGANPAEDIERVRVRNGNAPTIYPPADIKKLLAVASPDFLPVLAIGAFAGLRSAELERLEWADVDFSRGFISVAAEKAKTRSRRLVPICDALRQWLAPFAKKTGRVWKGTHDGLYDEQRRCASDAGLEWESNALRHSFISYRLAEVQNAAQVSLEAGNSPQVVFAHYRELVTPEEAREWFAVKPARKTGKIVNLANV